MDARAVHRELGRNALSAGEPSAASLQVLNRMGLRDTFRRDPAEVLGQIHAGLPPLRPEPRLFALAELSFLAAERNDDRKGYLAAAVYAYAFLFPETEDAGAEVDLLDPRARLAADLYNRSVALGLAPSGEPVAPSGSFDLLPGRLEIAFDPDSLTWAGYELVDVESAAALGVRGLLNRYRRPGIGAPLVARTRRLPDTPPPSYAHVPEGIFVPLTALLRIEAPRLGLRQGRFQARLEIYASDVAPTVDIGGRSVPLEYEASSALAASLADRRLWDFELAGFFDPDVGLRGERRIGEGLTLLQPYRRGRVPVVFVHGTASSPGRWADPVNEMLHVPLIHDHFQPWLFSYNTGQPIAFSAMQLRETLRNALTELDPSGADPALQRVIVVGHSQGGLLTKMLVVSSGDRFRERVSARPIEELDLPPEARDLLQRVLVFEPVPNVHRVVFIATPHRGSFLAKWRISNWIRNSIALTGDLVDAVSLLVTNNPEQVALASMDEVPNSLDNMTPDNGFLLTLAELPIAPGVRSHSIIAVRGSGPAEQGNDGVVTFESAHLEGVDSEVVVRSGHSAQSHPGTIAELGRILFEDLQERGLVDPDGLQVAR